MGRTAREQLLEAQSRTLAWAEISADYLEVARNEHVLQVRNAQLDKEAMELRAENDTLNEALQAAKRDYASASELEAAVARAERLQVELVQTYKDHKSTVDQLEIVRRTNDQQNRELDLKQETISHLRSEIKKLREEIAALQTDKMGLIAARDLAIEEHHAVNIRVTGLEAENIDLVERLMRLKDEEIQRMAAAEEMGKEILADAKRQAREIIASARLEAAAAQAIARLPSGVPADLGAAATTPIAALGAAKEIPSTQLRSYPGIHAGGCYGMAFDATGGVLASCGVDKVVRLWDSNSCTPIAQLRGAHEAVNDVAFTCDGKVVLGAEDRAAVRLWDVRICRLINCALTGHSQKVTGVDTSRIDPGIAYTISADKTIKMWKLSAGLCERTLKFVSKARRLAVVADSGLLISGHMDGCLRFWDPRASKDEPIRQIAAHLGREAFSVGTPSPGASKPFIAASCGQDNTICVVDTRKFAVLGRLGGPKFSISSSPYVNPAFSSSGSHLAAGSEDGGVFIWEVRSADSAVSDASLRAAAPAGELIKPMKRLGSAESSPSGGRKAVAVWACAWNLGGLPLVSSDRLGGVTFWGEGG